MSALKHAACACDTCKLACVRHPPPVSPAYPQGHSHRPFSWLQWPLLMLRDEACSQHAAGPHDKHDTTQKTQATHDTCGQAHMHAEQRSQPDLQGFPFLSWPNSHAWAARPLTSFPVSYPDAVRQLSPGCSGLQRL